MGRVTYWGSTSFSSSLTKAAMAGYTKRNGNKEGGVQPAWVGVVSGESNKFAEDDS